MVNNAGVAPEASNPCPVNNTTEEVFDLTWQVNVRGTFLGCKYAGAQMLRQPRIASHHRAGAIINVSSVLGLLGLSGTPAYAASKGAVIALTRAVAMDYAAHGIHCNAILPGCMVPHPVHFHACIDGRLTRSWWISSYANAHDRHDDRE